MDRSIENPEIRMRQQKDKKHGKREACKENGLDQPVKTRQAVDLQATASKDITWMLMISRAIACGMLCVEVRAKIFSLLAARQITDSRLVNLQFTTWSPTPTMALSAHTIYGRQHFDGVKIEDNVIAGQPGGEGDANAAEVVGRIPPPPVRFVPAKGDYDELGRLKSGVGLSSSSKSANKGSSGIGDWYSSLSRTHTDSPRPREGHTTTPTPSTPPNLFPTVVTESSLTPSSSSAARPSAAQRPTNWFKSTSNPHSVDTITSTSTLADMLRRDPPNPRQPLTPPVYYAIGPTNKGYEMLSRGGWREGQPLGRRRGLGSTPGNERQPSSSSDESSDEEEEEKWNTLGGGMPKLLVTRGNEVDVVDLTRGRNEENDEEEVRYDRDGKLFKALHASESVSPGTPPVEITSREMSLELDAEQQALNNDLNLSHIDKPLLTPIAVALKNDREGLGLTKKTRLVTHSSLAIHQHIEQGKKERRHHISEARRMEREHRRDQYGRGKRAFARMAKEEADKRKRMMEYMNS